MYIVWRDLGSPQLLLPAENEETEIESVNCVSVVVVVAVAVVMVVAVVVAVVSCAAFISLHYAIVCLHLVLAAG